jgi:ATP synthase protein I
MPPDEHEDLKRLGERIEQAGRLRREAAEKAASKAPPTPAWIAIRFVAELVAALIVGGCIGWCIDWAFDHWSPWHTRPWGVVVFFVLGVLAGIKNVMAAAKEITADMAKKDSEK